MGTLFTESVNRVKLRYGATIVTVNYTATTVEIVMLEKLDCILSKRATRPYIYESTSVNACVRIYV